jgi:hypothetical protein
MIAEIIPEAYDAEGRTVSRPFDKRRGFRPTLPMGRYVSGKLTVKCESVAEVRQFLRTCRYVSDEELFGKREYWQPPEDFEKRKQGDCEDFSLWTWRQFMAMGYEARFVMGEHGRYGTGHAWVVFFQEDKCFLVEPLRRYLGAIPRLSTLGYKPEYSVAWDGKSLSYFAHKRPDAGPSWNLLFSLVPEWLGIWGWFWLKVIFRLPILPGKLWKRMVEKRAVKQTLLDKDCERL